MPADALRGRAGPLTFERSVRLLACDFSLVSDCEAVLGVLDLLVQHPSQRYPVSRWHRFEVGQAGAGYRLREDGRELGERPDARSAAELIHGRMNEIALDALPEFTKIHAGCATWRGRRLVAAGPTGSGKTTLMTRLLYEGFAVHCDDVVLLRGGEVLPYPRRFRVRPGALRLIPQIFPLAIRAAGSGGGLAVDPSELGFDWRIDAAPADAVFFLEPARHEATRLEACSRVFMAERIMSQSSLPDGGARDWVKEICTLVEGASCYVLRTGDLARTVAAVKDALGC